MLVDHLKANHSHIIKNLLTYLTVVEDSTKTTRRLWNCVPISIILVLVLNGCFFATTHSKYPCDSICGAVKTTCSQAKPPNVF